MYLFSCQESVRQDRDVHDGLDQMLCQDHPAEPDPQSVESHQCGQYFLFAGPDQQGRSYERDPIELPDVQSKYQSGHDHCGFGQPAESFHDVVVGPVAEIEPKSIAVSDSRESDVPIDHIYSADSGQRSEDQFSEVHDIS